MSALRVFGAGAVAVLATLAGCGGSSGDGSGTTYTIGGTVMGLNNGGTVSVLLGTESLSLTSNGTFTFPSPVTDLTQYAVTVGTTMPTGQTCGVANASGAIAEANVTNVGVYCTDDVSAATLNGTYEIASLDINNDTDQLYTAVPFDGSGTQGSSTVTTNQAGTFSTSTDNGGVYTVTTAEALPVFTVGANNAGAIAGADGDEFYWVTDDVNGGGPPALFLGVKPLQTATLSSLTGNWTVVGLTLAATAYDSEGSIAIGADGSFSGSAATLDITGAAVTQTVSGAAGAYAVTNNVVSVGGQSGYISANGNFAVLTAVTQQPGGASANSPGIAVAVKQGSGMTLASLNGVYSIAILGFETASTGNGGTLTLYFDGAGNFGGTATQNSDGTYSSGSVAGTYTLTSNGALTLTDSAGDVFTGGVSADGNEVAAAYLTASAATPEIIVGFKQ